MNNANKNLNHKEFIPENLDQSWSGIKNADPRLQGLVLDLKTASNMQTQVNPDFADKLQSKLLLNFKKQGGFMKNNFFKWPYLLTGGVLLMLIFLGSGMKIKSPLDLFSTNLINDFSIPASVGTMDVSKPSQAIGKPYSGIAEKGRTTESKTGFESMTPPYQEYDPGYAQNNQYGVFKTKNASVVGVVKNVFAVSQETSNYIESIGGVLQSSNIYKNGSRGYRSNLSAMVPEDQLSAVIKYVHRVSDKIISESMNVNDVTRQVDSYQSRLDSLNNQKAEYQRLLDQATKINDKINLQNKLNDINLRIKNLQANKNNLESRTKMSNINISFQEKKFLPDFLYDWGFTNIIYMGRDMLARVLGLAIVLVMWGVVFTPIWLPIVLVKKYLDKRKK